MMKPGEEEEEGDTVCMMNVFESNVLIGQTHI